MYVHIRNWKVSVKTRKNVFLITTMKAFSWKIFVERKANTIWWKLNLSTFVNSKKNIKRLYDFRCQCEGSDGQCKSFIEGVIDEACDLRWYHWNKSRTCLEIISSSLVLMTYIFKQLSFDEINPSEFFLFSLLSGSSILAPKGFR